MPSPGNCAAGGDYADGDARQPGFVVSEKNGRWGQAVEVPGLAALNEGRQTSDSVGVVSASCASPGTCAAGGDYEDRAGKGQGFVAVERHGVWGQAMEVPGLGALNTFMNGGVDTVSCASAGNCAAGGSYEDRGQNGQGFVVSERKGVWARRSTLPA